MSYLTNTPSDTQPSNRYYNVVQLNSGAVSQIRDHRAGITNLPYNACGWLPAGVSGACGRHAIR